MVIEKQLTVSEYITLAPPPATIVQMRPLGFKTVNFKEALVWNKKSFRTVKAHTNVINGFC